MKCDGCGEAKPGLNHIKTTFQDVVIQDGYYCSDCVKGGSLMRQPSSAVVKIGAVCGAIAAIVALWAALAA